MNAIQEHERRLAGLPVPSAPRGPLTEGRREGLLEETFESRVQVLSEAKAENGHRMRVKAELLEADVANRNRRVYKRPIVEREVGKLQERIKSRIAFGSGDHPADARTSFDNVTHLWDKVWMEGKKVFGEATILNTDRGRTLQEIIRVAGSVPVSARGFGTVSPGSWDGGTAEIVEDNYQLVTFDFVLNNPGFEDAKVVQVKEEEGKRSSPVPHPLHHLREQILAGVATLPLEPIGPLSAKHERERLLAGCAESPPSGSSLQPLSEEEVWAQTNLPPDRPLTSILGDGLISWETALQIVEEGPHVTDAAVLALNEQLRPSFQEIVRSVGLAVAQKYKDQDFDVLVFGRDHVIVTVDGVLYRIPFEIDPTGAVILGDPREVVPMYLPAPSRPSPVSEEISPEWARALAGCAN